MGGVLALHARELEFILQEGRKERGKKGGRDVERVERRETEYNMVPIF